jgi:putative PIN family toxin of toxin-antitoxin system
VRFVLDTNVVISVLVWGGVPYKLFEAAVAGDIELVSSPALLAELRDVLSREHLALRLAKQWPTVEQAIALYAELAINISPLTTPRVVPGDIDDDHVIAAAVAGTAEAIVSGDRHLLGLGNHQGIAIVKAADAVRRVEDARGTT